MTDGLNTNPLSPVHGEIVIYRAHNGWVVRSSGYMANGCVTPMAVAETPEGLALLVHVWAAGQALEEDKAKRRE